MPRRPFDRQVSAPPPCGVFKPAGVPASSLEDVVLTVDEYEAVRLADHDGLYQEQVAERMGVSRQTVGRILRAARGKIAEALVHGKTLRIEGGPWVRADVRFFACADCRTVWDLPFGGGRPEACPECGGADIHRTDDGRPR